VLLGGRWRGGLADPRLTAGLACEILWCAWLVVADGVLIGEGDEHWGCQIHSSQLGPAPAWMATFTLN
jgi:hypothetical protein